MNLKTIYQSKGQSERMTGKNIHCGYLQCGIFSKLIHQQHDKIRDGEFKECTWKYYYTNIAVRYLTVYWRVCGNGLLKLLKYVNVIHAT